MYPELFSCYTLFFYILYLITLVDCSVIVQQSVVLVPLESWTCWGLRSEVTSTHNRITMTTAVDGGSSDRVQYNRWNEENINIDVAASQTGLVGWEFNVYEKSKSNTKAFKNDTLTVSVNGGIGKLLEQLSSQPNKSHSSWLALAIRCQDEWKTGVIQCMHGQSPRRYSRWAGRKTDR